MEILSLRLLMHMACADHLSKASAREAVADRDLVLAGIVAAVVMVPRVADMGNMVLDRAGVDMAHLGVVATAHLQAVEDMGLHHEDMVVL